mgnify:CR=1 FL=1
MHYRPLGKTGINVSTIVYGGIVSTDAPQDDSDRYVAWAIEQGMTSSWNWPERNSSMSLETVSTHNKGLSGSVHMGTVPMCS